ncbi:MAG: prepilin-type N-terminal cleavage/methylation domain-containing protein [Arenimonas sp.]
MLTSCRARRQFGFTLLEAIIALVIFTMGAIALYGWLGVNLRTLARVQERREAVALTNSALDAVRRINPMETPRGRRKISELLIEWEAKPVELARPAVTQVGLRTIFEVQLFTLDVNLKRSGVEIDRFSVRQLGYKQVGTLEEE